MQGLTFLVLKNRECFLNAVYVEVCSLLFHCDGEHFGKCFQHLQPKMVSCHQRLSHKVLMLEGALARTPWQNFLFHSCL
jgi:hypothetical protein